MHREDRDYVHPRHLCRLELGLIAKVYEVLQNTTVFLAINVNNTKTAWRVIVTEYPHMTKTRYAPQFQHQPD